MCCYVENSDSKQIWTNIHFPPRLRNFSFALRHFLKNSLETCCALQPVSRKLITVNINSSSWIFFAGTVRRSLQLGQRRLVSSAPPKTPAPAFPGEPSAPSIKTAIPGPKSQAVFKDINELQARAPCLILSETGTAAGYSRCSLLR